ncbi:MAG: histidine kinase [Nocardia sp.]|uniref:sensor histidine kinase n=1 Tax=Nocardia sp. TaxID=1821 RepID=UPI0026241C61|nr:nitrate- and nitrite sensing domain-containing protein [Nocardia sp.]MCU1646122.1 histidine kinase [Nocardia sp.]
MLKVRPGIRARILAIALVPCLALLGIGTGAAGYLAWHSQHLRTFVSAAQRSDDRVRGLVAGVERERLMSLWQLAGAAPDSTGLAAARVQLDSALRELASTISELTATGADKLPADMGGFTELEQQLPIIRGRIDDGAMPVSDVYAIYSKMLDGIGAGMIQGARSVAPSPDSAVDAYGTVRMTRAIEALSRSSALAVLTVNGSPLPEPLAVEFRGLVGYYHAEFVQLTGDLRAPQGARLKAIMAEPAWQTLAAMENYVIERPAPDSRGTNAAPVTVADWRRAVDQIGGELLDLWQGQRAATDRVSAAAVDRTVRNSLAAGGAVLAIALLAFGLSLWLANRLIGRLRRLRTETLALAEVRLPEAMRRLREGEQIDLETESAALDFGHDEIGTVAAAFNTAHTAGIAAAVAEARIREGVRRVFLNIAHRSQIVVHRQLEILDEAEREQEDPALLDIFFRLDHLATRERRNAENLTILGGGQPGRKWRRPVPMLELIRSAVGETLDYSRVRVAQLPAVYVIGAVVADLIHLVAELVDNATSFSPPQSRVDITGTVVGRGVAVEISDQGVGMTPDDLRKVNEMLTDPPDFGVETLSADARLGLFVVAQLGTRYGISVRLGESDYGGIRAIVLVPSALVTTEPVAVDHLPQYLSRHRADIPPPAGEIPAAVVPGLDQVSPARLSAATRVTPNLPRRDVPVHPDPSQPDFPVVTDAAPADRLGRPALPKRRRQASLAPELARSANSDSAASDSAQGPPLRPSHSADQARERFSAIENGTRQGRRGAGRQQTSAFPDQQEGDSDFFNHR